jgi:O-antigen/teichoic acid export membrane protein
MPLRKNILANYVGTAFVVLAPMLALPYYLHALGSDVWGLVSFITTLQALLSLLDAGISQALVREFAVAKTQDSNKQNHLGTILFGFERVYWIFSICAGVMVFLLSHQITQYWLKLDNLNLDQAQLAIFGAATLFIFQFPGSVYRSFLVGTQAQVLLNSILTVGVLIRHVGCVIVVLKWPTLFTYLVWQISAVALETMVRAFFAWSAIDFKRSELFWDKSLMRGMLLPIAGMSGATLLGVLTVQMDKIILSGMVSVEKFGYYAIASTLAIGVLQLIYPIMNAATPYAASMKNDTKALRHFNFKHAKIIILIITISGLIYYALGYIFLSWWLNNLEIVKHVYEILNFLLIGTALNALYTIGHLNWIVKGQFSKIFHVNLISLIASVFFIPVMINMFGMVGASIGWILINVIGLLFSLGWLIQERKNN